MTTNTTNKTVLQISNNAPFCGLLKNVRGEIWSYKRIYIQQQSVIFKNLRTLDSFSLCYVVRLLVEEKKIG